MLIGPVALDIRQGVAEPPDFEAGAATAHPLRGGRSCIYLSVMRCVGLVSLLVSRRMGVR